MHAERLPESMCIPSSVLIAQAVYLLERGHTHNTKSQIPLITLFHYWRWIIKQELFGRLIVYRRPFLLNIKSVQKHKLAADKPA